MALKMESKLLCLGLRASGGGGLSSTASLLQELIPGSWTLQGWWPFPGLSWVDSSLAACRNMSGNSMAGLDPEGTWKSRRTGRGSAGLGLSLVM